MTLDHVQARAKLKSGSRTYEFNCVCIELLLEIAHCTDRR